LHQNYPEYQQQIENELSKTGSFFQGYIKRGYANIALERSEEAPLLNVGTPIKRRESSTVNSPAVSSADDYKMKLAKLQQMFTLSGEKQDEVEKSEEKAAETIEETTKSLEEVFKKIEIYSGKPHTDESAKRKTCPIKE
jgi:hypothetical protein